MQPRELKYRRTDMWREGKWLDLWSVVHFLSGISIGLGVYVFRFGSSATVLLVLLALIAYEMWEMIVRIEETPTNRLMDVVVGMTSFLPVFFLIDPQLSREGFVIGFIFIFVINVTLSVFGWRASQKAATLEKRMRERYDIQRARLIKRREKIRKEF